MRGTWTLAEDPSDPTNENKVDAETTKLDDAPLFEMTDNAEFRMHDGAIFKIDSNGITMNDGTNSVTFTVQQLIDVLNLPNASNV